MNNLKYRIALVAYYGPLIVAAILVVFSIFNNTLKVIQLHTEIYQDINQVEEILTRIDKLERIKSEQN